VIPFQQTDTVATYTGAGLTGQPTNAGGTVNRLCVGTPGSAVNTVTLDAFARDLYAVSFDIPVPNPTLWLGGRWVIRLNVRLANASVCWNRTYLYRLNSAGTNQGLMGSLLRVPQVFGTPGVKQMIVPTEAQPLRAYGDRVLVVCTFVNQGTLPPANLVINSNKPQAWSFVADQFLDSPFSGGN
jgi:hypothetical protein